MTTGDEPQLRGTQPTSGKEPEISGSREGLYPNGIYVCCEGRDDPPILDDIENVLTKGDQIVIQHAPGEYGLVSGKVIKAVRTKDRFNRLRQFRVGALHIVLCPASYRRVSEMSSGYLVSELVSAYTTLHLLPEGEAKNWYRNFGRFREME